MILGWSALALHGDLKSFFVGTFPYIGIMLALVFLAGRTALPAALGMPYSRESR